MIGGDIVIDVELTLNRLHEVDPVQPLVKGAKAHSMSLLPVMRRRVVLNRQDCSLKVLLDVDLTSVSAAWRPKRRALRRKNKFLYKTTLGSD